MKTISLDYDQQRQARIKKMERTANDWVEAFDKQKKLIKRELSIFPEPDANGDTWFTQFLEEIEIAKRIYLEEESKISQEIRRLKEELRRTVIERIKTEIRSDYGMEDLCDALERDDPTGWLEW